MEAPAIAVLRQELRDMRARADNLIPAWEVFLSWLANAERVQFVTEGERWRTLWRALDASTVAGKREDHLIGGILVRTGELRRSLSYRPFDLEVVLPHELQAGTRISYAHFHQTGTRYMPQRTLIDGREIEREGAASSVLLSWIMTGHPVVRTHP